MPLGGATLVAFAAALIAIEVVPVRPGAASLAEQAAALATRLEREATAAIAVAGAVRTRLRAGEPTNWKDFNGLVSASAARTPMQKFVAWAPRVPGERREDFEAESGRDSFRSFRIVAAGERALLDPAKVSGVHHPIAMTAPLAPGGDLLGLDLGTLPGFAAAFARLEAGDDVALVGPRPLLPTSACHADDARPGCAGALFVVVAISPDAAGSGSRSRDAGYLVVALSWAEIALSATVATAESARYTALPESRSARATFRLHEQAWSLELRRPVRAARAKTPLDVLFDPIAQTTRGN